MSYRGIIIEESLVNKEILSSLNTLDVKVVEFDSGTKWHMHKVEVPDEKIHELTKKLINELDPNGTWYTHFYHTDPKKDNLIVVYYKKRFLCGKDSDLSDVIAYGLAEGIPEKQLDFVPRDVVNEAW